MPQERMAPRSRLNDLLVVTVALSVLLIAAILAASFTFRVLTPNPALAIGAGDDYADPLVLNRPPPILLLAHATPARPAMPILKMVPGPHAPTPKRKAERQARHVSFARTDLYLPPLIDDTITAREADTDREIYDARIRLFMAGRCDDERQDQ